MKYLVKWRSNAAKYTSEKEGFVFSKEYEKEEEAMLQFKKLANFNIDCFVVYGGKMIARNNQAANDAIEKQKLLKKLCWRLRVVCKNKLEDMYFELS